MKTCARGAKRCSRALAERADVPREQSALIRKRALFVCVALFWLLADQVTKALANAHEAGEVLYASPVGFLDVVLVHNTGAAWGAFSGATAALGVVSLVVCALIAVSVFAFAKQAPWIAYLGLGLVFAGGVGNAIDRFWHGYVVDFISTAFMDFPVFNIADVGVTVGVALFIISLFVHQGGGDDGATDQPRGNGR